ncbi:MAG TPA: alternative ribosome rescue aminoacyl-tRNA hydrolase ArfB [Kofleriaceae bacterium]|nr:alternative ribosome rescue aminoacyl-tRNA hydrolase ArfB [Kofleriaceae bacterium]
MNDVVVNDALTIPAAELAVAFARSGGPGGQHVNKTETKVELRWRPGDSAVLSERDRAWLLRKLAPRLTGDGELIVVSSGSRSQATNRREAGDRLAEIVRAALIRPKPRKKTRPSRGAIERRLAGKRVTSQRKRDRRGGPDD